jgi:colicin import membrane protein
MNALVTIDTLTPEVVFVPGGVEAIVSKLEADVRSIKTDMSTESGRKEIASLAYKVARSKTALDEMGKELVAGLKAQSGKIDAERKVIRDRLDALKDEVRKPLTDWENADKDRIAGHEQALITITAYLSFAPTASVAELRGFLEEIGQIAQRDWQEFAARANGTLDEVRDRLNKAMTAAQKREDEAAELARLRAEQAAREQADREARIAAEAAESARIAAENKAAREAAEAARKAEVERLLIEQEKAAALAKVAQAEADRKAAAEKAERDAKQAAEAAEKRQAAAIEAERKRVADEAAKAAAEVAKRNANTAHKSKINTEVLAALVALGLDPALGKAVITAIVKGNVPHTKIEY